MSMHPECLRDKTITNVPTKVPIALMSNEWALKNHSQDLARLNQRGGMGVTEILDNIHRRKLSFSKWKQTDVDELNRIIENYGRKQ